MAKATIKVETVERVVKEDVTTYVLVLDEDELYALKNCIESFSRWAHLTGKLHSVYSAISSIIKKV